MDKSQLSKPDYLAQIVSESETKPEVVSRQDYIEEELEKTNLFMYFRYAMPDQFAMFVSGKAIPTQAAQE